MTLLQPPTTTIMRKQRRGESLDVQEPVTPSTDSTTILLQIVLRMIQTHLPGRNSFRDFGLLKYCVQRCRELDTMLQNSSLIHLERNFFLNLSDGGTCQCDSGYTLLHDAIYKGDICRIIFLLRGPSDRIIRRPMEALYSTAVPSIVTNNNGHSGASSSYIALRDMVTREDNEGLTPAALLAVLQCKELAACRKYLEETTKGRLIPKTTSEGRRSRSSSLFEELSDTAEDEQNEFDLLSRALRRSSIQRQQEVRRQTYHANCDNNRLVDASRTSYGCEVVTFGRAHHCALGVVASNRHHHHHAEPSTASSDLSSDAKRHQFRPQRVQAFAQDTVGRTGSAVAIASATFHTLTVTASGELYAFGLGKGGRLGTGDEKPCSTPVRVLGPLMKQIVIGIAAAENHSLCVTAQGFVYAFGSNRFGQLGISTTTSKPSLNDANNLRCVPRRIDDLKQVICVNVAAGLKHSVALSQDGEVYVWGDNSAGQLGINSHSVGSGVHKVQRVEALWKATPTPKIAIAICASDQTTLAIVSGSGQKGLAVNSVYAWGNGNHIPCKAHFGPCGTHVINPIAISCAKYHNVAVTSSGHVYSWGFHADSLGTSTGGNLKNRSSSDTDKSNGTSAVSAPLSAPKLVTGMLPENGGGKAILVSASENHTAVVTDDGHLWTWGETYKQNVLGHEGVRWQPEPKRVPGVHRAVAVSAAKEHTVLLIGTSFPPLPSHSTTSTEMFPSLETLAARTIAQHCDLFNIIPIMTTAERTQTTVLLDYCKEFVRLNLDGVLNVSQKSAMDSYLNEQLLGSSLEISREDYRDDELHPFVLEVILAGSDSRESFGKDRLCNVERWLTSCDNLSRQPLAASLVKRFKQSSKLRSSRVLSSMESKVPIVANMRKNSFSSERCDDLISNMDLSTKDYAEEKLACLTKEARAIRKRLSQILKLERSQENFTLLTNDEKHKIARRPQLEAALLKLDQAIETVESKLRSFVLVESDSGKDKFLEEDMSKLSLESCDAEKLEVSQPSDHVAPKLFLQCCICEITCPDPKSYELHMNGRKHRNRMSQVAIDETKQAAVLMVAEHRKQLLLRPTGLVSEPKSEVIGSAWDQVNNQTNLKPKYTLPPPPHPTPESVVIPSAIPKLSFEAIMAEEARMAEASTKLSMSKKKGIVLQLPMGCPPTLKSPPWETAKKVPIPPPTGSSLSLTLSPRLKSTPASIRSSNATTPKSFYSIGDFIPPSVSKPAPPPPTPRPVIGWTTPVKEALPSVSLRVIQNEEHDFKSKQDQTFGSPNSNSKWFVEKRERAGSLKEIQGEAAKKEESRLLIEEQIRIEKQIYDEIAAAAKKQAAVDKKSIRNRCQHKQKANRRTDLSLKNSDESTSKEGSGQKQGIR
jgi:alpha-tubulin suppressor-like RCC1 family protein